MLEAVLNHVNKNAKIPLCGMISGYNKVWTEREGVRNLLNLIGKEVNMQGFMVFILASFWGFCKGDGEPPKARQDWF
ncbi:(+)-pulegone reductase-like [Prunus avium]|uniref:(+)-pulegone reductase-like n=1 Tax=Prunus avium TaxID=42229 RepID=A0A6P5T6U1_PRUAV|nr:(+)-pulegone reductase-like [Prunus avium]